MKTLHYSWELGEARIPDCWGYQGPQVSRAEGPLGYYTCKWGGQLKEDLKLMGEGRYTEGNSYSLTMADTIMTHKDVPCSNHRNLSICYITQQKKLKIKLRLQTLREGSYPGSSGWAWCNHTGTWMWKRQAEICSVGRRLGDLKCERGWCTVVGLKMEEGNHEPRNVGRL